MTFQTSSNNYRKVAQCKRNLERGKAAYAKSQNRKLANDILRNGKDINTENVSVKGWQKRYGKAISAKSPAYFQSELKRKAESAGGSFTQFSTQTTALQPFPLSFNTVTAFSKPVIQELSMNQTGGNVDDLG
jgi:hypothetical protein